MPREAAGLWGNTWSISDQLLSQFLIMENIKKTCLLMIIFSFVLLVNLDGRQLLHILAVLHQRVDFMPPGAAQSPRAATQTDPGHLPEVCPALDRREAVWENQGHCGEVWGPWRCRRSPAEEASGEERQDQQLGKINILKTQEIISRRAHQWWEKCQI